MHRQIVSHCISVPRPHDWLEVLRLADVVATIAEQRKFVEHRFGRLKAKPEHFDVAPQITVHIEGWVEKE